MKSCTRKWQDVHTPFIGERGDNSVVCCICKAYWDKINKGHTFKQLLSLQHFGLFPDKTDALPSHLQNSTWQHFKICKKFTLINSLHKHDICTRLENVKFLICSCCKNAENDFIPRIYPIVNDCYYKLLHKNKPDATGRVINGSNNSLIAIIRH